MFEQVFNSKMAQQLTISYILRFQKKSYARWSCRSYINKLIVYVPILFIF